MTERLSDILTSLATRNPDGISLTFLSTSGDERNVTARQLHGDASRIAWRLRDQGIQPGELLPLVFDHGYEVIVAFWGCLYAGAIPTILPFVSPDQLGGPIPEQVRRLIRYAEAAAILAPSSYVSHLQDGLGEDAPRIIPCPELTHARAATAASVGTETIVVICEMRKLPTDDERTRLQQKIRERVRQALAVFVADVAFVNPGWFIRTTSGKINRGANREKYKREQLDSSARPD